MVFIVILVSFKVLTKLLNIAITFQEVVLVDDLEQINEHEESKIEINFINDHNTSRLCITDLFSNLISNEKLIEILLNDIKNNTEVKSENSRWEKTSSNDNIKHVFETLDLLAKTSLFELSQNELDIIFDILFEKS